jgi:hypothetical protein
MNRVNHPNHVKWIDNVDKGATEAAPLQEL